MDDKGARRETGLAEAPSRFGREDQAGSDRSPVVELHRHRRIEPGPPTVRVLVVEDEEEDFLLIEELLARAENTRFLVERASDAEGGLAKLLAERHDACLVDYRLPGQDGLSLARAAARRGVAVPVILLSGVAAPELEIAAIEAGAADFLDKEQFEVERLERAIRLALARASRSADPAAATPAATGQILLRDRVKEAVARARRQRTAGAVLCVAVDGTQDLLQAHGPEAVGTAMDRLAERLRRHLRAGDALVRLDGCRFGLVLEQLPRPEDAALAAGRLLTTVGEPLPMGETQVALTASVGAARFPADSEDAAALELLATAALERAARGGRCCHHDRALEADSAARLELARELERAIAAEELVFHFQPQVTLCSPQLALAAVARWRHPGQGLIEGERLRALAETAGLVDAIDDRVIASACCQARRWRDEGLAALHVAVPLFSRRQLGWSGLEGRVEAQLAANGLPPGCLEIELEEKLLLAEIGADPAPLRALAERGVRLAVDGFGGGATALAALRDAPVSTVKLARRLLQGVPDDRRRTALAISLIDLARRLELRVVATGVESQSQLQMLKAQGCDAVQSFASCPPLPAGACTDWLRQAAQRA